MRRRLELVPGAGWMGSAGTVLVMHGWLVWLVPIS